jgi:Protein of unknown function (DUF1761)
VVEHHVANVRVVSSNLITRYMKNRISLVAVTITAVMFMAIGALWYGAFAEVWARSAGISMDEAEASGMLYFGGFCVAWVTCLCLALLINALDVSTIGRGMRIGLLAWLGFAATSQFNAVLWAGKSPVLFAIDAGYLFVTAMLASFVLTLWRKAPKPVGRPA